MNDKADIYKLTEWLHDKGFDIGNESPVDVMIQLAEMMADELVIAKMTANDPISPVPIPNRKGLITVTGDAEICLNGAIEFKDTTIYLPAGSTLSITQLNPQLNAVETLDYFNPVVFSGNMAIGGVEVSFPKSSINETTKIGPHELLPLLENEQEIIESVAIEMEKEIQNVVNAASEWKKAKEQLIEDLLSVDEKPWRVESQFKRRLP